MKILITLLLAATCCSETQSWLQNQFQNVATRANAIGVIGGNSGIGTMLGGNSQQGNIFSSGLLGGQFNSIINGFGNFGGGSASGGLLGKIIALVQAASAILNIVQTAFGGQQIAPVGNLLNAFLGGGQNVTTGAGTANAQMLAQNALALSATDDAGPQQCARGVRLILERLGIASPTGILSAKDWEPWLKNSSAYSAVPVNSVAQAPVGSIIVFNTGEHGHIAIVGLDANGNRIYVSDKGRTTYEETRSGFTGFAYVPK